MPEYSRFREYKGAIIGWLGAAAVSDVLIAITLTWSLVGSISCSCAAFFDTYYERITDQVEDGDQGY